MKVTLISALMIAAQLSPATEALQKRFPYPVIRDMRGVVPPGPRPLPSPPPD